MMEKIIIGTVISVLAGTVKNPRSKKAQSLRRVVQDLAEACENFLAATDPEAK